MAQVERKKVKNGITYYSLMPSFWLNHDRYNSSHDDWCNNCSGTFPNGYSFKVNVGRSTNNFICWIYDENKKEKYNAYCGTEEYGKLYNKINYILNH